MTQEPGAPDRSDRPDKPRAESPPPDDPVKYPVRTAARGRADVAPLLALGGVWLVVGAVASVVIVVALLLYFFV